MQMPLSFHSPVALLPVQRPLRAAREDGIFMRRIGRRRCILVGLWCLLLGDEEAQGRYELGVNSWQND